jgi:hypothetical protein
LPPRSAVSARRRRIGKESDGEGDAQVALPLNPSIVKWIARSAISELHAWQSK